MLEEIYALAVSLVSEQTPKTAVLRALCRAAENEVALGLREPYAPEDCRDNFLTAAALLAVSHYLDMTGADAQSIKGFSVGDVSLSCEDSGKTAAMRVQAKRLMAPFSKSGFSFLGVF